MTKEEKAANGRARFYELLAADLQKDLIAAQKEERITRGYFRLLSAILDSAFQEINELREQL